MIKIIGDPGSTHGGTLEGCLEAVDIAKQCGLLAIKFQLFKGNKNGNIEVPRKDFDIVVNYARKVGIDIFASVFDEDAIDLLIKNSIKKAKLAYSENFNLRLIKKLKENNFEIWASGDNEKYPNYANVRLYCIPEYPIKRRESNYNYQDMSSDCWHGISSHYLGYRSDLNCGRNIKYLEKHFHINQKVDCPDYWIALSPKELGELSRCLKP